MRRKKGQLLEFEQRIMDVIGEGEMHGTEIARRLAMPSKARYGSLYKALRRLERIVEPPRLVSSLEPALLAEQEGRPRRRYYRRPSSPPAPASPSVSQEV